MAFILVLILLIVLAGNFGAPETGEKNGNIAEHKPAFSSSFWWKQHSPEHGNDGLEEKSRPVEKLTQNMCSWTTSKYGDRNPWWAVDLGGIYAVKRVTILHMVSYGKPANIIIEMFQHHPKDSEEVSGKLCIQVHGRVHPRFFARCKKRTTGRILRVKKFKTVSHKDVLAVCEYFVFGYPVKYQNKTKLVPPVTSSTVTATQNKTNHLLATKQHQKINLRSLFSCSTQNNNTGWNEERNNRFCHLSFGNFPKKFQKWIGGIKRECRGGQSPTGQP